MLTLHVNLTMFVVPNIFHYLSLSTDRNNSVFSFMLSALLAG